MGTINKKSVVALAFSVVALPLWAAHVDSTDWNPTSPVTIGTTQIQPGDYQIRAEEGKTDLQVVREGKVVATIPCQWINLPNKAESSEIVTDGDKVTQVQFGGHTAAVQVAQ